MPLMLSSMIQVGLPMMSFSNTASLLSEVEWEETIGNSLVVREPVGVVGAITPWNYPLHQIAAKVAAALGAGCTVVLKPSEVAPLNAFVLMEILQEVELPPGVVNLVSGTGPVVGEAIASHPLVDMVSFTGSTRAGKRVMQLASETIKRVALELGGKSANIILEDADLQTAVTTGVTMAYMNSGQTCSAHTRMIVPRSRLAEVEEIAAQTAETLTTGDPFDPSTRLGPLVSATQRERVRGYIHKGEDEGATLLTGGAEAPDGLDKGYFVRPTVFSNVSQKHDDRPGGDLRPRAVDQCRQTTRTTPFGSPTTRSTGSPVQCWAGDKDHAIAVATPHAHRPGRRQRRRLQRLLAVRRVQAVRHRPRARQVRDRGVPRAEGAAAIDRSGGI